MKAIRQFMKRHQYVDWFTVITSFIAIVVSLTLLIVRLWI